MKAINNFSKGSLLAPFFTELFRSSRSFLFACTGRGAALIEKRGCLSYTRDNVKKG